MTNSGLVNYTKISPNKNSPRNHEIDTITIHCVVGQLTVESIGDIFQNTNREASSNYGIGTDGKIGLYVDEADRSWCSSDAANDNRAITIEVACDKDSPYTVNDVAYESLITLVTDICLRNNITKLLWKADPTLIDKPEQQNMTVHRWFANTACPGNYLYTHMGDIADKVNNRLEVIKMTTTPNEPADWSRAAREWAVENNLFVGDENSDFKWTDPLTREQLAVILQRYDDFIKQFIWEEV